MYSCQTDSDASSETDSRKQEAPFLSYASCYTPCIRSQGQVPYTEITSTQTTMPMLGGSYQLFPYLTKFVAQI